ncbi:MAG TPA: hypothetical protein VG603_01015 [Chitinophagales bacterium]|nr:hypothetical protein [Chitinophagales bacterium]
MRNFPAILFVLLLPVSLFSQKQVSVVIKTSAMSKGSQPAFEVDIPQTSLKDVERDWKKYLGVNTKAKVSETTGEILAKGASYPEISKAPFNIYSKVIATTEGVTLTAWFTPNDSIFFSKGSEATAAQRFVRDFAVAEYYLAMRDQYQDERQKLEKMKDELEKQVRDEEKSNIKIADNKRAIARAQEDLATNANDQKDVAANITLQQTEVTKARSRSADALKEADNQLKKMEDDLKKLKDKEESLHKKIDDWNKQNTAEARDVDNSEKAQKESQAAIEKQKQLIANLALKMKAIK